MFKSLLRFLLELSIQRLLPILLSFTSSAQIQSLTTNRDATVLYFSTDAGDPQQGRIYRWKSDTGIQLAYEIAREGTSNISNFYYFLAPFLSADGTRLVLNTRRDCIGGNTCALNANLQSSVIDTASNAILSTSPSVTRLSRNGQYMLRYFFPVDNTVFRDTVVAPNLLPLPGFSGRMDPGQVLSNFGQVVVSDPAIGGLFLWTPQRQEPISTLTPADPRLLTADGRFLVYRSQNQLWAANTLSGKQSLLFEGSFLDSADLASLSSDDNGRRLLMLIRERKDLPRQWLFTVETNGDNPSWFTFIGEGFREAIYSGDGQAIFATSTSNRLFRYRYSTDSWDELNPRSAYVTEWLGSPWTGSQNQLQGGGFSWQTCDANSFPWPESLCGVELTWLGRKLPIGRVTPTSVNFQIPWDLVIPPPPPPLMFVNPAQFDLLAVSTPKEGFFNDSGFSRKRENALLVIDESSLRGEDGRTITKHSPARPGEWLLVELTGLGAVSPAIPTGMPAPANPPSRVTEPIEIEVNKIPLTVQSFQAILTPGQVGIYTLRFQLPTSLEGLSSTIVRIVAGADPNRLRIAQFQIPLSTSRLP